MAKTENKPLLLNDEELENKLYLTAQADIGFDGRRLTKCRMKYEMPGGWEESYEPTPIEYAREIAHVQREADIKWFEQYCRDNRIYQVKRIQPKYIANEYEFKEVKLTEWNSKVS